MDAVRPLMAAGLAMTVAACGSGPGTRDLAREAAEAMGGLDQLRNVRTITMRDGEGTRHRLGQTIRVGDEDAPGTLAQVVETIDLEGNRAALDYRIRTGSGFEQHRQEVLTRRDGRLVGIENVAGRPVAVMSPSGLFSWGTQNSAMFLLRRNVVTIVRAAAEGASEDDAQDRTIDGRPYHYGTIRLDGEEIGLYFDPDTRLLAAFEATDTEPILGDVRAIYQLDDYRSVDGLQLPHAITIRKGDQPFASIRFGSIAVNDPSAEAVFAIPDAASAEVDRALAAGEHYSPVELDRVADGVYFVRAYSHNSLLVEFPEWLAVVEAPYTEAQSHTLVRLLEERFPGKPVRYGVVSHHHYDHVGGVRGLAAHGATILTARGNEGEIRPLVESRHTNPPDELERRRQEGQPTGQVEVFDETYVLSEGDRRLELYAISGNPHVDPKVLAFVPGPGVLFQSDIFFPGTGAPASPAAVHMLEAVRELGLDVRLNAGGHGGVAPFAELEKAGGN
jgi:glyoxylase-like metal-dependent hydrolase (beta-lactamase superfamily II)